MSITSFPSLCAGWALLSFASLPLQAEPSAEKPEGKPSATDYKQVTDKSKLSSFYRGSHILFNRGTHTVIPKGSIIYLPAKDKTKISDKPSGKFVFWPEFIKKNQNWIWTYDISWDQAKGLQPISESKLEEFAKMNRMVVATYQKSPINILPPPSKPEDADKKKQKKN